MLQTIILSIILVLSLSLPLTATPTLMGLWILTLALLIAIWASLVTLSWFRIILFIIYVSGMLVIFAYFVAIAPNQPIQLKLLTATIPALVLACFTTLSNLQTPTHFTENRQFPIQQYIFLGHQRPVLVFLVLLLFFAMVLAVKISDRTQGPLRPFN